MSKLTKKQKAGCLIGMVTLFLRFPLAWASAYLMLVHVQATDVMWLLFWIAVPLTIVIEVMGTVAKGIFGEDT